MASARIRLMNCLGQLLLRGVLEDPQVAERVRTRAAELVAAHPLYPEVDLTGQA
jgi:hypothetical protein